MAVTVMGILALTENSYTYMANYVLNRKRADINGMPGEEHFGIDFPTKR